MEKAFPPLEVTAANVGCPACHVGVSYDASGFPDPGKVWLGQPNPSISMEAYPAAIYRSFLRFGDDPRLWTAIDKLHPDLSARERRTLKYIVLPAANKRLAELESSLGRAVPFRGGYPGATNGLDSLHVRLGVTDGAQMVERSAFNSIPNLQDHDLRTSFLNVGNYKIPNIQDQTLRRADLTDEHINQLGAIVAFFTVPSMGVTPEMAESYIPDAQNAMRFAGRA